MHKKKTTNIYVYGFALNTMPVYKIISLFYWKDGNAYSHCPERCNFFGLELKLFKSWYNFFFKIWKFKKNKIIY